MKLLQYVVLLGILFGMFSCNHKQDIQYTNLNLSLISWSFQQAGTNEWYPAEVPGNVISELKKLGKVPNPFFRFNEDSLQWIEKEDWVYKGIFNLDDEALSYKNKYINFEGLDTYADVYINDSLLFKADNMHVGYVKEVDSFLKEGENEIKIYFHSPIKIERQKLQELGYLPKNANERAPDSLQTRVFSRKAPFHYGWDWGPRLVTSGIWRPVSLNLYNDAHIESVFFKPELVTKDSAKYRFETKISGASPTEYQLNVYLNNQLHTTQNIKLDSKEETFNIPIEIENPKLWYTHDRGEPYLYNVKIELANGQGIISEYDDKLGIRDIKLIQEKDSIGRSFYFELNGDPLFAKGANYIPSNTLTTESTIETYEKVLNDAVNANMNMLRIWGGAIYENDEFYDLCDQKGILIWQDFMFACELTPPNKEMLENIKKEADYNVKRLRNHPSIALWCGNNENLRAWHEWGWKDRYPASIRDEIWHGFVTIFDTILPNAVATYHPGIEYWASSPASYPGNVLGSRISGDEHDWGIWFGELPFTDYGYKLPRFVSEYGVQAFPPLSTIDSFAMHEDKAYRSEVMEHRQRSWMPWISENMNGNEMILRYINKYYHKPVSFESYVYLSQMMQALALKTGIEIHRTGMPHCMGSLYWQINDCWPTMSWATVDYYGRWKAAHYAVKRAFNNTIVVPEIQSGLLVVNGITDTLKPVDYVLEVLGISHDGKNLQEIERKEIKLKPNGSYRLYSIDLSEQPDYLGFYIKLSDGNRLVHENIVLNKELKDININKPEIKSSVREENGQWVIELETDGFAPGVFLKAGIEGTFNDNYFDLLPNQKRKILFKDMKKAQQKNINLAVTSYFDYI